MAVSKSTISPLRTPRDGAWPTPRSLIVPSGRPSPTTTQIFDVPISRPTIKSLLAISFSLSFLDWDCAFYWRRRTAKRFYGGRIWFGRGGRWRLLLRPNRDSFRDHWLRLRINRVINDFRRRFGKCYWNISLGQKVDRGELLFGVVP